MYKPAARLTEDFKTERVEKKHGKVRCSSKVSKARQRTSVRAVLFERQDNEEDCNSIQVQYTKEQKADVESTPLKTPYIYLVEEETHKQWTWTRHL